MPRHFWATAAALLLAGCGPTLRPDSNPYSMASNVPTAEVVACGERVVGLQSCAVRRGAPLSAVRLVVQGYNTGTIRVTSDKCAVEYDARYNGHAAVEVPLNGIADENCVLAVSVQPEFPGERESGIVIGSLKAFVRLRVVEDGDVWHGFESKVPEGAVASIAVPSGAGRLVMRGCGAQVDEAVEADGENRVEVRLPVLNRVSSCVYEGVVMSAAGNVYFTWMVWRHSRNYVPAVEPAVTLSGDDLVVQGEPAATVVSLDGEYHVGQSASLRFDRARPHVVRVLTVGGRNVVGEYLPGRGFTWKR